MLYKNRHLHIPQFRQINPIEENPQLANEISFAIDVDMGIDPNEHEVRILSKKSTHKRKGKYRLLAENPSDLEEDIAFSDTFMPREESLQDIKDR